MTGAREVNFGDVGLHRPRVHPLFPVGVVPVDHRQGDRTAERLPVAHSGRDFGGVALDLHPPAAAVAELATSHVGVDLVTVERQSRWQTFHDASQAGTVGFTGGYEAQHPFHFTGIRRRASPALAVTGDALKRPRAASAH